MLWKILLALLLLTIGVGIFIQNAVTKTQIRTISDVRSSDTQGGTVSLEGKIIYARDNRFVLDDGTGKAELSTCPLWYKQINLQEGDGVIAVGQVMNNPSFTTKSDFVLSVYKIFRGADTFEVRVRPGKPPWITYGNTNVSTY